MHRTRFLRLLVPAFLLTGAVSLRAQDVKISDAKREMNMQVSQDKAEKQAKSDLKKSPFKGAVKTQVELGNAAYAQEQYAVALDRYMRAYEREKDSANATLITYFMGQCQQRLNHPKAASQQYNKLWLAGLRETEFLKNYVDVLFCIGDYEKAQRIMKILNERGEAGSMQKQQESLGFVGEAAVMQQQFQLSPDDVVFDSANNTPFSEYGPSLVLGDLYFSSSRPEEKQVLGDPRTGQGYSRLFSSTYDPSTQTFVNPVEVKGQVAGLHGNIGTFSYDSVHNIGYFTWIYGKTTGIFTVSRSGNEWVDRKQFTFNYKMGADDFTGKVAHPSISKDGNRLLFTYRDPAVNGKTDIWYVERKVKQEDNSKKKKKSASQSAAKNKKKGQQTLGEQYVTVNEEWGNPVRLSDEVNTAGREAFPLWINDTMFVFSSDGHVGNGGMDLYLAVVNPANHSEITAVGVLPQPINSPYDDDAVLPDPQHGFMILASNRYTTWGKTENLYYIRKSGIKHEVFGNVYVYPPSKKESAKADSAAPGLKLKISAADDTASIRALPVAASLGSSVGSTPDTAGQKQIFKNYYIMVTCPQTGWYESVSPDSTGLYRISYLNPGTYEFTVYSDNYKDCKTVITLSDDQLMLPVMLKHRQDFELTAKPKPKPKALPAKKPEMKKPAPTPPPAAKPAPKPAPAPAVAQAPKPAQQQQQSPRDIIKQLDKTKRYIPDARTQQTKRMDAYKKQINDPLRRFRLPKLPDSVDCEICGEKEQWKKSAKETVYVAATDDRAVISFTDPQGRITYFDLPQNSAYAIETHILAGGKGPSLPAGVNQNDIRRVVATRDYVLFECIPKLAEINDEYYINNVYFDFNKSDLVKDAPRELTRIFVVAMKNPDAYFYVEAHADERGSDAYNQALSQRRLDSVMTFVKGRGVDMSRVIGKAMGESQPLIAGAQTEEEHRLNRRTTFRLVNKKAVNVMKGQADYPVSERPPRNTAQVTFMVQIGAFARPLDNPLDYYKDVVQTEPDKKITYFFGEDGYYKYNVGEIFTDIDQARALVRRLLDYRECYIAAYYKGRRITVMEALKIIEHEKVAKK